MIALDEMIGGIEPPLYTTRDRSPSLLASLRGLGSLLRQRRHERALDPVANRARSTA